jgi:multiple sugar transport system substrate-binding protein
MKIHVRTFHSQETEKKNLMKKHLFTLIVLIMLASLVLTACGGAATPAPGDGQATSAPADNGERVEIRWFVGLGTGTNPEQIEVQQEVVDEFNASQDRINLVLEIAPYEAAYDTLATQLSSGAGPDIVGPVGWSGSAAFYGQWLDLAPYIESSGFDTSIFDPALAASYQTEEGQVGLPFAVFPAAVYYVPSMFDEAGLNYPPQKYGEKYVMPDGTELDWTWDTLRDIARLMTIDVNGLNSTEEGFDRNQITQVGYYPTEQTHIAYQGTYIAGAADIVGGQEGNYTSEIPDGWKEANHWIYDGMWGDQPFIATGPLATSPEFGTGNVFNSNKAAMATMPIWMTCCLEDFVTNGNEFQAAAIPMGADGKVHGRVDADTYRILKTTQHPEEAFTVLTYLITTGADKLLPIYGAMPGIASKTQAFFDTKSEEFPFVTQETWDVFAAGLGYPDGPSAEQYQPHWQEAWSRQQTFFDLMLNTPPDQMDFDAEWQKMIDDLNVIYNK